MRTDTGQVFKLEDYRPNDYLIPQTDLTFRLSPDATRVTAVLTVERRDGVSASAPLVLDGDGLTLKRIEIGGKKAKPADILVTPDQLTILEPPLSAFLPAGELRLVEREIRGWSLRYEAYPIDGLDVWGMTAFVLGGLGAWLARDDA